jgi:hypothetical protein
VPTTSAQIRSGKRVKTTTGSDLRLRPSRARPLAWLVLHRPAEQQVHRATYVECSHRRTEALRMLLVGSLPLSSRASACCSRVPRSVVTQTFQPGFRLTALCSARAESTDAHHVRDERHVKLKLPPLMIRRWKPSPQATAAPRSSCVSEEEQSQQKDEV